MGGWDQIRKAAAGPMSEDEHVRAIREGVQSLKDRGIMPRDGHPVETQARFDTGHRTDSVLNSDTGDWTTYVVHDADPGFGRVIQLNHGDLGGDHSRLGESMTGALRNPQVMQSMREQMEPRAPGDPGWHREFGA